MDDWKNRGSKDSTLCLGFFTNRRSKTGIGKVGVTKSSLNKRNGHQCSNLLLLLSRAVTFSIDKVSLTNVKFSKNVSVYLGTALDRVASRTTRLEVNASLVGKCIKKVPIGRRTPFLLRSSVECNSLQETQECNRE